jgi:cation/acetate symporter
VAWSLFFIFLLYFTAPAYAAFSKLEVYSLINAGTKLADLPAWMYTYGKIGLVKVCGVDVKTAQEVIDACAKIANHPGVLRMQDLNINTDVIVLSTPEIAGMPYVIAGLVAAGGLAAALSTADGLLLAIANALSHDVYYNTINRIQNTAMRLLVGTIGALVMLLGLMWIVWGKSAFGTGVQLQWVVLGAIAVSILLAAPFFLRASDTGKRLVMARVLLFIVAIGAATAASTRPADILSMVAWAFSLAAAGIFPALVMGIWWKRATTAGAVVGMILGFGICTYYLVGTRYFAVSFHELWGWLGTATKAQLDTYASLKQAWIAATDPAAKAAAWARLDAHAQTIASWWGVRNISAALFGLPLGFLSIWIVSLFTAAPSKEVQDMVDATRLPRGETILQDKGAVVAGH